MQNMGLLMEYEDILLKKRKDFSATHNYFADIDYIVATGGTYDAWSEQFNNVFRYMDGLQIIPGNINDPDLSNIYSNVRGYYYQRVNQIR